jgi:hypothetical protein
MDRHEGESAGRTGPDDWLPRLVEGQSSEAAALALANLSSRVVTELYKLARTEAQARRGQADWGRWAKLANAARNTALQSASCRDVAREIAGAPAPSPDGGEASSE